MEFVDTMIFLFSFVLYIYIYTYIYIYIYIYVKSILSLGDNDTDKVNDASSHDFANWDNVDLVLVFGSMLW